MILRHDRSEKDSVVKEKNWPALTSFFRGRGCATLISSTWLLTAAHVARHIPVDKHPKFEIAGKPYVIAQVILHPEFDSRWEDESKGEVPDLVDLAAVELETFVEAVEPFNLYQARDELGQEVLLLGSGEFGNGLEGGLGFDRGLRQATNSIDEVTTYWLKFRFDAPPGGTDLEGVAGRGDSGGPAFIRTDQGLLLAGISSWRETFDQPVGLYGCIENYTRVSSFLPWIRLTCGL